MPETGKTVGLPIRDFMYTVDQIAFMLEVSEAYVKRSLLFYEGRSTGVCPKDLMSARNIAPAGETPEWRVLDRMLVRWMRFKGFKVYERGYLKG